MAANKLYSPCKNEHDVHQTDEDARAGHWLYGHLAAHISSFRRRGIEILSKFN
jgi:hypothetical protein